MKRLRACSLHLCMFLMLVERVPFTFRTLGLVNKKQAVSSGRRVSIMAQAAGTNQTVQALNVLGTPLQSCCFDPLTGYYRDGFCRTGGGDYGVHVVCAQVTAEFLEYTASRGNDLSTPAPGFGFPGLKPGDRWCLCASRWKEAADAGKAPPVVLSACHIRALDFVDLELLKKHAAPEQPPKEEL